MADFVLKLAGIPLAVHALHESTESFCIDYITHEQPIEHVALTQADIDAEHIIVADKNGRDGLSTRSYSDAYLETLALYRRIADVMIAYDALVFHGCALAFDGKAYLFTAPSGTGKTTHARFWLKAVEGSYVLNGDKPLLRLLDGKIYACATPWKGKEGMGCNENLPLAGLCILERGEAAGIEPVSFKGAFEMLIRQTHRLTSPKALVRSMQLIGEIGTRVPLYRMACTLDETCALVSYEAMVAS